MKFVLLARRMGIDACSACKGTGLHQACDGKGCMDCGYRGYCSACKGTGRKINNQQPTMADKEI